MLLLAACAGTMTRTPETSPSAAPSAAEAPNPWPVKTREHVDLWLHGYALLTRDTARVPLFRPGYREAMLRRRAAAGVTTALDANMERLEEGLADRPSLVNGQFVPLYFAGWEELREAVDLFLQAEGNPRRAATERGARVIAFLAASFPSAADRDWLRLFIMALDDERDRFYRAQWSAEQERRAPVVAEVNRLWQGELRPRFQGFLNNTLQLNGDLMLALPLGGEGRTVGGRRTENVVAVTYPDSARAAIEAVYVFAHEVVGTVAQQAVDDHTTPAEKRDGVADRLQGTALVRGGAMLLQRVAPELADGYARYYLSLSGARVTGEPLAALERAFPLPAPLAESLARQIELVLGGI
ncbi:MAG TPA: hypothetical protein VFX39_01535 [Gemmatimonadaceae bacterium]|nr:hypothetical protein [Gemmatimonadaceae bacterium]